MYTLTWIEGGKIVSISSPVEKIVLSVWFGLLAKGIKARQWYNGKMV
jgi:hypothetical protein